MRYFTQLKGQTEPVAVDIEAQANGRYVLLLGDVRHEVDALRLDHGAVSLIVDGRSYNIEFEEAATDVVVSVKSQVERVDVADERAVRLRAGATHFAAEGKQVILAPMPGKVVKLLVKLGDEVQQGQGLVVVEAMKMENELKSPKAGKVTELFTTEGSTVENNAKLLVVE